MKMRIHTNEDHEAAVLLGGKLMAPFAGRNGKRKAEAWKIIAEASYKRLQGGLTAAMVREASTAGLTLLQVRRAVQARSVVQEALLENEEVSGALFDENAE